MFSPGVALLRTTFAERVARRARRRLAAGRGPAGRGRPCRSRPAEVPARPGLAGPRKLILRAMSGFGSRPGPVPIRSGSGRGRRPGGRSRPRSRCQWPARSPGQEPVRRGPCRGGLRFRGFGVSGLQGFRFQGRAPARAGTGRRLRHHPSSSRAAAAARGRLQPVATPANNVPEPGQVTRPGDEASGTTLRRESLGARAPGLVRAPGRPAQPRSPPATGSTLPVM